MGIALTFRYVSTRQEGLDNVDLGRDCAIQQGQVERIAMARFAPRLQTGQDANDGIEAGHDVRDRHSDLGRRALFWSGDLHQATQGLNGEIVARYFRPGAGPAEPRDGTNDEPWVYGVQRFRSQPQLRRAGGQKVLEHDVAPSRSEG